MLCCPWRVAGAATDARRLYLISLPYRKVVLKSHTSQFCNTAPYIRPFVIRSNPMSDTYRRYRAIKRGLMQFYQLLPGSHREGHFNTLAALSCGLTGGQRAHLSVMADHAPSNGAKQESVIERKGAGSNTTARPSWLVLASRTAVVTDAGPPSNPACD